jgi:antitoxin YqcF
MTDSKKNSLPSHLERFLGEISQGWADPNPHTIQVACFDDQPRQGITTYVTLGLSDMVLPMKGGRTIRQELVTSAYTSIKRKEVAGYLLHCAEQVQQRGYPLLRGETVNMRYPLIEGATVTGLYATNPTPFEDGFAEFSGAFPSVIFVLMIPITGNELSLIADHGWNCFEDMLEFQNPDIWDLKRAQEIAL